MKRKITTWSIVIIVLAGMAWIFLPAWMGQSDDEVWSIVPVMPPVQVEEKFDDGNVVIPQGEAVSDSTSTTNEKAVEPEETTEIVETTKTSKTAEAETTEPTTPKLHIPQGGELEFKVRGEVQGRERYTFTRLEGGGLQAYAEGKFYFEIAYIPLELDYRQLLLLDANLSPVQYKTQRRGPLGLGNNDTNIDFGPSQAIMVSDGNETLIPLQTSNMIAISMFATFSLLTQWFEVGQPEATFMALDAGGFEDGDSLSAGGYRLGGMKLVLMDDVPVQTGETQIHMQRYAIEIDGPQDGFQLLFHENQWVGMRGEATDDAGGFFTVYRTDVFPNGFEVVAQ